MREKDPEIIERIEAYRQSMDHVRREIARVVVGQHLLIRSILIAILAR